MRFLYIDPIKQGLKQIGSIYASDIYKFLYIDPIKQGLKRSLDTFFGLLYDVFIHRSNKTRIETRVGRLNQTG